MLLLYHWSFCSLSIMNTGTITQPNISKTQYILSDGHMQCVALILFPVLHLIYQKQIHSDGWLSKVFTNQQIYVSWSVTGGLVLRWALIFKWLSSEQLFIFTKKIIALASWKMMTMTCMWKQCIFDWSVLMLKKVFMKGWSNGLHLHTVMVTKGHNQIQLLYLLYIMWWNITNLSAQTVNTLVLMHFCKIGDLKSLCYL